MNGNGPAFERVLASSRYLVIVAVVTSLIAAVGTLWLATVDLLSVGKYLMGYSNLGLDPDWREYMRSKAITGIIKGIDGYLLATVLILVSAGLYELFISRIEAFERSEFAAKVLLVRSLDDLKERLSRVVMLILIVTFLQKALELDFGSALDLLYLAIGIALVGGAIFLGTLGHKREPATGVAAHGESPPH